MKQERLTTEVSLVEKCIWGSITEENKYDDDTIEEVIAWLRSLLAQVPDEYKSAAKVDVDSVGGYEGEHHAEIKVYYERPETDEEMAARIKDWRARDEEELQYALRRVDEAKRRLSQ